MAEKESRLLQEATRLREESDLIDAQRMSLGYTRPQRYASRFPLDYQGRTLFNSPDQSTPPRFMPPRLPAPPPHQDRFHTPPHHFSNPVANVMAATQFLANAPIQGDTPADRAAWAAVDFLKTSITHQGQYSEGVPYLHGTPYRSVSRQAESPAPAVSCSQCHHRVPLTPPGGLRIM